jgi:hypothetical protein
MGNYESNTFTGTNVHRPPQRGVKWYHAVLVSDDGVPEPLALGGFRWTEPLGEPWPPEAMAKCGACRDAVYRVEHES